MGRLTGKVAVITGAGCVAPGWGNGRAASVLFAREGATVVGTDINLEAMEETANLLRETDAEHHLARCDVTDSASIENLVEDVLSRYGRIDVLVNNVGGSAKGGAGEMSEELWLKQLNYNLTSVFLMCKHVLPVMKAQNGGSIVDTASPPGILRSARLG